MTNYLGGDETTLKASGIDTHDGEKELPSSVELVTDDFERASLGDEYVGDTGDASIVTSPALEGSRSLEISRSSTGSSYVSYTGGDVPQLGDTFEYFVELTDTDDKAFTEVLKGDPKTPVSSDTAFFIKVGAASDEVSLVSFVDGSGDGGSITPADISNNLNERLKIIVELGLDRSASLRLLDSSGTELASLTNTISSEISESGATAFEVNNGTVAPTQYFDGPFITRRTTEELSERKRGATETSKLETAGGVGAGPRELPENEPAGILADQGVTSDLSQGTQVGYGLQLNGERGLELKAEADGSGGIQNSVVDLSGLNSDLRLGTGQSIQDGSSVRRITLQSDNTRIRSANGKLSALYKNNSVTQHHVRSGVQYRVFDEQFNAPAYTYTSSATTPGTLELTNATLDARSIDSNRTSAQFGRTEIDGNFRLQHSSITLDGTDSSNFVNTNLNVGRASGLIFVSGNGQTKPDAVYVASARGDFTDANETTTNGNKLVQLSQSTAADHQYELQLNNSDIQISADQSGFENEQIDITLFKARNG